MARGGPDSVAGTWYLLGVGRREDNETRTLRRASRGYALAMADAAYLARVRARLTLESSPADLWCAIDWTWSVALGGPPPEGPIADAIVAGAEVLAALLSGDKAARARWSSATNGALSLSSTLSSHPFPDQAAWLLRKTSLAS
jgi:hypothetical protein